MCTWCESEMGVLQDGSGWSGENGEQFQTRREGREGQEGQHLFREQRGMRYLVVLPCVLRGCDGIPVKWRERRVGWGRRGPAVGRVQWTGFVLVWCQGRVRPEWAAGVKTWCSFGNWSR